MDNEWIHVFIVLLLSHLLGEFLLQTKSIAKNKTRWARMVLHCLIVASLAYLFLTAWQFWQAPLIILVSHFLIDFIKLKMKMQNALVFILDQALHLVVLVGLTSYIVNSGITQPAWLSWQPTIIWSVVVVTTALFLLLPFGGLLIGQFVKPYQDQLEKHYATSKKPQVKGLEHGGRIIGYLERCLILAFILLGQYTGIGFLVAAKSVFRFGEFKESENRMEAEYIIIGTFASFLYAIAIGSISAWLITK